MKHAIWIPFALLLGLVLGGWGPREDLKLARQEIELLRSREDRKSENPVRTVTDWVRIPPRTEPAQPPPPETPSEPAPEPETTPPSEPEIPSVPPPDLRARIDEALELWKIRSEIARNTFVMRAKFGPEEAAQFDVLLAAMNLKLRSSIEQIAVGLRAGEDPTPETGLRAIHTLSGALASTYDEMDRTLPPGWRVAGDEPVDLVDFVDPSVAEPLIGLEDRIPRGRPRRRVAP